METGEGHSSGVRVLATVAECNCHECMTIKEGIARMNGETELRKWAMALHHREDDLRRAWDALGGYLNAEISGFPKVATAMRTLTWGRVIALVFDRNRHYIPDPVAEGLKRGLMLVGESDAKIADSAGSL